MSKRACPECGSVFFVTSKSGAKTVFHVNEDSSFEIIAQADGEEMRSEAIFCGACNWRGDTEQLIESRE